jgi:tRNA-modifying protein YgfZ
MVKRNVDPTATLVVDGIAAAQEVVVDPEIGLHVRPRL